MAGTARGNFLTTADSEVEFLLEQGFFHCNINLIGDGGLFGTIDFLLRRKTNGEDVVRDRGSCHFAG